jgi:hypothetical protein
MFPSRIQRDAIFDGQGRHMAQTREFPLRSHQVPSSRSKQHWKILIILCASASAALYAPPSRAQLQQDLYLGPSFPSDTTMPLGEELDAVSIDPQSGILAAIRNLTLRMPSRLILPPATFSKPQARPTR